MEADLYALANPAPAGPHFHPLVIGAEPGFTGQGDKQVGVGQAIGHPAVEYLAGATLGIGGILHIETGGTAHRLVQGHKPHVAVALATGVARDKRPHGLVHCQ